MSLRVIRFSTGNVGRRSLRAIINRPGLELVGVHVNRLTPRPRPSGRSRPTGDRACTVL